MSDVKVIPDTNVIVAASIIENMHELDIIVKHRFYDQSIQLFSLFHPPQSTEGYAMPQVKIECFGVLSKAVKDVFVSNRFDNKHIKEKFYNEAVGIISSSEHKMRNLLGRLRKPRLDNKKIEENLKKVKQMSNELRSEYQRKYQKKKWQKKESKSRSKSILTEPKWKKEQKDEVVDTHRGQVVREAKQLERFVRKPNGPDEIVLAQAVTFKETLDGSKTVLIASSDTGFFSPYHYYGGKSDTVTEKIYERFGITCDHPRNVFRMAGGTL